MPLVQNTNINEGFTVCKAVALWHQRKSTEDKHMTAEAMTFFLWSLKQKKNQYLNSSIHWVRCKAS